MRWSNTPPLPAICALVITAFLGCSGTETASEAFTVRDSAGVTIAHSRDQAWTAATAWRLAETPSAVIGDAPDSTDQLWQVRGLVRLGDGRLVVLNAGTHQLRFYDPAGVHLFDRGRPGEGPGDFVGPRRMIATLGDTLMILDRSRVKYFDSQGRFLTSRPGGAVVADFLANGNLLRYNDHNDAPPGDGVLYRPRATIAMARLDIDSLVTLEEVPGWEQEFVDVGQFPHNYVPPFARNTTVTSGGPLPIVVIADNETYEFHVYSDTGVLQQIVRRDWVPRRTRSEWFDVWKAEQRSADWTRNQLPDLERAWAVMAVPEVLPAYEWVTVSTIGQYWVLESAPPGEETVTFAVFERDGRLSGTISVPPGLTRVQSVPPFIDRDVFMGVWIGELGVEQVRVYRIERPS